MPRIPRGETAGGIYHVINRGNMRMQVFDDMEDYEYFLELGLWILDGKRI